MTNNLKEMLGEGGLASKTIDIFDKTPRVHYMRGYSGCEGSCEGIGSDYGGGCDRGGSCDCE